MTCLLTFLTLQIYVFWLFFFSLCRGTLPLPTHGWLSSLLGSYLAGTLAGPWDWLGLRVCDQKWCSSHPGQAQKSMQAPHMLGALPKQTWRCWSPQPLPQPDCWSWAPMAGLVSDRRQPFAVLSHWDLRVVYYRIKPRWSWQMHKDLYQMRFTVALLIIV